MEPILEIKRLEISDHWGTFGVLLIHKKLFCVTLEPPPKLNKVNESSIPAGQYQCLRVNAPRVGDTFWVRNVPGRKGILFHPGNTREDTKGCIILAEHVGKLRGNRAILNSGATFKKFLGMLSGHNTAHLTITDNY